jgi:hypothetical protein
LLPFGAQSDSKYFGTCKPDLDNVPERCTKYKDIDYEWRSALACGWFNSYTYQKMIVKALDDLEEETKDPEIVACATAAIAFKNGRSLCETFGITLAVLNFSRDCTNLSRKDVFELAEEGVQERSPTFNAQRDCASFFDKKFNLDKHTDAVLDNLEDNS